MRFIAPLIAVTDMERSKRFYKETLSLSVVVDYGENVTLEGGVVLQEKESWADFIGKESNGIGKEQDGGELYFEEEKYDEFLERLEKKNDLTYVHPPIIHRWGQRVVRFRDPDGHIIEVGEPLSAVISRFRREGMDDEAIAERMDIPLSQVKEVTE